MCLWWLIQSMKHQPIIPLSNCDLSGQQQQSIKSCNKCIPSRLHWVSHGPLWLLWHLDQGTCYNTLDLWKKRRKKTRIYQTIMTYVRKDKFCMSTCLWFFELCAPFTISTMLSTSPQASRSECKQDGAEPTTSDPSHQNVTNLLRKNSNHLTWAVSLLQTLSHCNNLTSLSTNSPEHFRCVISKQWENPFPPTWKWPWTSNFSLG